MGLHEVKLTNDPLYSISAATAAETPIAAFERQEIVSKEAKIHWLWAIAVGTVMSLFKINFKKRIIKR